jgi:glycosyltransferase involved in cell wall biosynthesis/peptidoglycan/xylan/chitin deacetylase (PgdA/CDA1 family)
LSAAATLGFVIPAHNAQATLLRTLASLVCQTRPDWQAVVIDDGSTDATREVAGFAAECDARISLCEISHSGVSKARNFGLDRIHAEWICFLDADDWLAADFNKTMLDAVGSDLDLIYCGYRRITPAGDAIEIFSRDFQDRGFECAARECPTAIHSVIVRRALVAALGGFDPSLATCEDWDLWQRLSRAGARISAVPEFLAMYQMNARGLSRQYRQVIPDAHKVIKRGFSTDPRVKSPLPEAANGAHGEDGDTRCSFFTAWCAAAEVGAGHDGAALLTSYPSDCGGHISALGKSLALALAVGARTSMAELALVLPRLKSRYDRFLQALANDQSQPGAARGIGYAIEREILHALPAGMSAQINQTAKVAVDLRAIAGVTPAPGVDVAILDFVLHNRSRGQMETAIMEPCSKADIAGLALEHLGLRKFVELCGLWWRPDYYVLAAALSTPAIWRAALVRLGKISQDGHGLRAAIKNALKHAAVRIASGGEPPSRRQMKPRFLDQPPQEPARLRPPLPAQASETRSAYWDRFFAEPDPWDYGCDYEQSKYRRTLDLLPSGSLDRVVELGCAEGMFTKELAKRAKTLLAVDISDTALNRAREQCGDCRNTEFKRLDMVADEVPGNQSLILCSEILCYAGGQDQLRVILHKLRDALAPGGRLVTANAFLLQDDMTGTGFDWDQEYGAKIIHEALLATPELALEQSIVTELYRIDCFKRCDPDDVPAPVIRHLDLDCALSPSLSKQIVWGGAWRRRSELAQYEQCWEVPVLAYHRIARDGPASLRRWRVDPDTFRKQLRLLRAHGYHSVTSADLVTAGRANAPLPGRPVLITFDDGYQDFADTAWPILEAEGFTAEVFIVTDRVGTCASWDADHGQPAPLMNWQTIAELHRKGVKFGSHLATHTPATNLSSHALLCEMLRSRADLESRLGVPVLSIAAPHGAVDERTNRILASVGYQAGFSGEGGKADVLRHRHAMPKLQVEGFWSMNDFARALEITPAPDAGRDQSLVTVVIPAYNAAHTVDETLRSVRSQTHRNLEILVVDDGSMDATPAIVANHAAVDARVRLIAQENAGVAAARNRGIAEAKSDLIAPLDADDLWAPSKIEKQLWALRQAGEKTALVYTWFAVIDSDGHVRDLEHQPRDAGQVLRRMCRGNLVGNGSSALMRKSAIVEAGGFDSGLRSAHAQGCEDLLLYFRIAERHDFALVPEHLTGYRRHPETMSEDALQMLRSYHLVTREMYRKYPVYADEIRLGEADLADWLMRKALRKLRLNTAVAIFTHIARTDLRYSLAKFLPGLFARGGRKLLATQRRGAGKQTPPAFQIGSPGNVEAGS